MENVLYYIRVRLRMFLSSLRQVIWSEHHRPVYKCHYETGSVSSRPVLPRLWSESQAAWVYLTRAAGRRARVDWHKVAPWASAVSVGCRVDIKGSCSWCYLGLQAERMRARAACRLYKTFHKKHVQKRNMAAAIMCHAVWTGDGHCA